MKQFLVVLAAIGVALVAYELYRRPQVEESRLRAEEARLQAEALKQQASTLAEQVETARKAQDAALRRQAEAQQAALQQQADAHAAALKQQSAQTRLQSEALQKQAQELSRQASAMKQEVDSQRQYAEKERAQYQSSSYLAEGFQVSMNAKTAIMEYYFSNGSWPSSNEEVGFPAPEKFVGRALAGMAISAGGEITLIYNEKTGVKGGVIRLVPDASTPEAGVKWRCRSPSYPEIAVTVAGCEYTGPKPKAPATSAGR